MKQIVTAMFFCLLLTLVSGQTNRTLFVAIDTYSEESGWNDIHATNDRKIVLPMFLRLKTMLLSSEQIEIV